MFCRNYCNYNTNIIRYITIVIIVYKSVGGFLQYRTVRYFLVPVYNRVDMLTLRGGRERGYVNVCFTNTVDNPNPHPSARLYRVPGYFCVPVN